MCVWSQCADQGGLADRREEGISPSTRTHPALTHSPSTHALTQHTRTCTRPAHTHMYSPSTHAHVLTQHTRTCTHPAHSSLPRPGGRGGDSLVQVQHRQKRLHPGALYLTHHPTTPTPTTHARPPLACPCRSPSPSRTCTNTVSVIRAHHPLPSPPPTHTLHTLHTHTHHPSTNLCPTQSKRSSPSTRRSCPNKASKSTTKTTWWGSTSLLPIL